MGARVVFHLADVAIASPWAFMDVIELCPMWLLEMEERRFMYMGTSGMRAQALTHKVGPNADRCDNDMPKR